MRIYGVEAGLLSKRIYSGSENVLEVYPTWRVIHQGRLNFKPHCEPGIGVEEFYLPIPCCRLTGLSTIASRVDFGTPST